MNNLFSDFFGEGALLPSFGKEWTPSADISETKDAVIVKAELPGLEAKDIEVTLSGNLLTLRGERKAEKEENTEQRHYAEMYYGEFQRSFQLPANIQENKVTTAFDKGVLKITFPKTEEAKTKEIKIEVK
jgi:HSP20 family protein